MNRERQFYEMAVKICECMPALVCDNYENCKDCLNKEMAKYLYNAGYRKASDVAREIIAYLVKFADDKERRMSFHGHSVWYIDADDVTDFIDELKKKYTEGEG